MSLKQRLTLILCALIIFLMISVSYFLYHKSASIINQDANNYMAAQLERTKENIDLLLEITQLETENLASDLKVRRFLNGTLSANEMNAYLRDLMAQHDPNQEQYMDLFILDLSGHISAATKAEFMNLDLSTRDYVLKSRRTGTTVTSDILIARSDGSLVVNTVSPIYDDDGTLLAHAGIAIYAEYLSSVVKTFDMGENGYYIILDSENRILSHPDVRLIATEAAFKLPDNLRTDDLENDTASVADLPVIQPSEGDSNLMMFKRMASNQWVLIAVLPESELLGKSISLLSDVIFIGLITTLLALLVAFYISGKITAPIVAITESIDSAAKSSQRLTQSVSNAMRDLSVSEKLFDADGKDTSDDFATSEATSNEIRNLSGAYQNFKSTLSSLINNFSLENEQLLKQTHALTTAIDTRNDQTARFVSVLSHDLRTTLTLIKGYSKALTSNLEVTEAIRQKFLLEIVEGAEDLERITSDILDSAYEAQAEPKLRLEEVDAAQFASRIFENAKRYIEEAGLTFEGTCGISAGLLTIDPVKISRVWNNLMNNAVKYSQAKGVIRVKLYATDSNLVFRIEDNGIGIPAEEQSKIFDMFFSGQHNRKQGYGLGLFIAKSFLQAHDSTLQFESELNKGTTFWFELPLIPST